MNSSTKIGSLTSLRFFAAALIVLGHGGSKSFFNYTIDTFDLRHAVSFFFVLSGFILSHAYQNMDWRTGYQDFIAARISRIWPAHMATALLAVALISPVDSALKAIVNLLMLQSLIPIKEWHYSFNSVSWSISTEMMFYVLFPFALVLTRKKAAYLIGLAVLLVVLMAGGATLMGFSSTEANPGVTAWGWLYISPITRIAEFFLGMAAYQVATGLKYQEGSKATLLEVGSVLLAMFGMVAATSAGKVASKVLPQFSVWIMTAGACGSFAVMIAVLYGQRGAVSKLLAWKPLVYLGEISFSLYLIHQIVIRWMFANYRYILEQHMALAYIAYWLTSIAAAAIIYHVIETPLRNPLRRFLSRKNKAIAKTAQI